VQILISAGEASGEMYGAELIDALRAVARVGTGNLPILRGHASGDECREKATFPTNSDGRDARPYTELSLFGAGGERMRAAGCDIVVDAKDLAVVGITEVLSHLPKILGLYKKLIRAADERRPAAAVVIDAPAFNWRVARQMRRRGIPVVYYVCPQFWAWRQGRVKLLRKYVDKALVIFPFEEKFYRDRGVDATFVGHPLADLPAPAITREAYAAQHSLDPAKYWITLMPGSRRKEVRMNLPTIVEAAARLNSAAGANYEFVLPVARTLEPSFLESLLRVMAAAGSAPPPIHYVPESLPALFHSRGGIIASGTATVEAALMATPFVMVYRVSALTYRIGKPRVKVPHFAMVNLIAGKEVVPELVQQKFTAANVVTEMSKIIPDGEPRQKMLEGLATVRASLKRPDGAGHPADRAAEVVLSLCRSNTP
jgi:lipid-A-disaccharide synthase